MKMHQSILTNYGMTLIKHLCTGHVVKALQKQFNFFQRRQDFSTCLDIATKCGHIDLVKYHHYAICKLLLQNGADVCTKCGPNLNSPLHIACLNFNSKNIELLIIYGAEVWANNKYNIQPLGMCYRPEYDKVWECIEKTLADMNERGSHFKRARIDSGTIDDEKGDDTELDASKLPQYGDEW